jgi:transcriptional regulator
VSLTTEQIVPIYQVIAKKAVMLRQKGLTFRAIAKELQTDDRMVRKAIKWYNASRLY